MATNTKAIKKIQTLMFPRMLMTSMVYPCMGSNFDEHL